MPPVCLTVLCIEHYIPPLERGGGQGTWQEAVEQGWGFLWSDRCLEPCLLPGWEGGPERSCPCHCLPASLTGRPRRVELLARVGSTAGSQECGVMGSLLWQHCCLGSPSLLVAPDPVVSSSAPPTACPLPFLVLHLAPEALGSGRW